MARLQQRFLRTAQPRLGTSEQREKGGTDRPDVAFYDAGDFREPRCPVQVPTPTHGPPWGPEHQVSPPGRGPQPPSYSPGSHQVQEMPGDMRRIQREHLVHVGQASAGVAVQLGDPLPGLLGPQLEDVGALVLAAKQPRAGV
jgi:hypothetical protein